MVCCSISTPPAAGAPSKNSNVQWVRVITFAALTATTACRPARGGSGRKLISEGATRTSGWPLATIVTGVDAVASAPGLSCEVSVITCWPGDRVAVKVSPAPVAPDRHGPIATSMPARLARRPPGRDPLPPAPWRSPAGMCRRRPAGRSSRLASGWRARGSRPTCPSRC